MSGSEISENNTIYDFLSDEEDITMTKKDDTKSSKEALEEDMSKGELTKEEARKHAAKGAAIMASASLDRETQDLLRDLRKRRGVKQARLTRTINKTHEEVTKGLTRIELEVMGKRLEDCWIDYKEAHEELMGNVPDGMVEAEEINFEEKADEKDTAAAILAELVDDLTRKADKEISQLSKAMEALEGVGKQNLPEIKLPTFDAADLTRYPSFWSMFKTMVDGRKDIDASIKMTYLKDALKGAAASAIVSLPDNEQGYNQAKRVLASRFGQKSPVEGMLVRQLVETQTKSTMSTS